MAIHHQSSLFLPLITLTNSFIRFIICIALYVALYYGNVWRAFDFLFLSQELFSQNSNSTLFDIFNETAILDVNNELNPSALDITGLPFFATTSASYLLTTNLGVSATVVHIFLWNYDAIKDAFSCQSGHTSDS